MALIIHRHPKAAIMVGVVGLSLTWMVENYKMYLRLSPGGYPPYKCNLNPIGWLVSTLIKPFGRETLSTQIYDDDPNQGSWLDESEIPERRGSQPVMGWHFLPHRQLDRLPSPEKCEELEALLKKHAEVNPNLVQLAASPLERDTQGLVIHPSIPSPHTVAERCLRAIGDIHSSDHSMHFVCSPKDCKMLIERGWAERHPLSGTSRHIPFTKEYVMIYAPRDDEELGVVEKIMIASIGYMTNNRDVQ